MTLIVIAAYGIICCLFLLSYDFTPKVSRKFLKTAFTFFEYSVFTFIIWKNLQSIKVKKLIILATTFFFLFQVFYLLTGKVKRLDTIPIGIETILVFLYIVYFFIESAKNITGIFIYNHYVFWIAVGILIYLGGSFFFFILINHLTNDQIEIFGNLTYLAEILKNILFAIAINIFTKYPLQKPDDKPKPVPYLDLI